MRNWSRSLPGRDCSSYFPPKPTPHRHRTRKVCSTDCSIKQVCPYQLIQKCILECMVRICGVNFYWCLVQMRSWYGMLDTMSWFTMFVHVITWTFMNMLSAVFPQVAQRSKPELFCVLWPAKVSRYPCVTEPLTLEQVSPCVHVPCRFVKIYLILNLSHSR